jgi:hypothetical protein
MAASVDRMWVRKEIDDFNRSSALPNADSIMALANKIVFHLRLPKSAVGKVNDHLYLCMDDDNGDKIVTNAGEILALFEPTTPAQAVDQMLDDQDGPGVNGPEAVFRGGPDGNEPHWSDPDADHPRTRHSG